MTGMKEGAGEDPFAEDESTEEATGSEWVAGSETSAQETTPAMEGGSANPESQSTKSGMSIPYKYRRDSVQDGRDRVPLFLHPETKTDEREAMRELEERFDDNISLTDLREALVKAGLENLDSTQAHLEEWGYGLDP